MTRSLVRRPAAFAAGTLAAVFAAGGGCASRGAGGDASVDGTAVARAENEQAVRLLADGRLPEAEQALRRALTADPAYGQAVNNLGLVHYRADDLYPAARAFDEATRLMPGRPEPHNNLGLVYERAGQLTKAADAYATAVRLEPDSTEYLGNLVRARVRRGDRGDDLRRQLEELVLRDARPAWVDWARRSLLRLNALPATQPAPPAGEAPRP